VVRVLLPIAAATAVTVTPAWSYVPAHLRTTLAAAADCRGWGNAQKTLQMGGNKVYWAPTVAWRCVTDAKGKRHVLAAIDSSGRLGDAALGRVAASGLDVSGH
jgi:hypothetical protein